MYEDDGKVISNFKFIYTSDYPAIPIEYLEPLEMSDLSLFVGKCVAESIAAQLPNVLFWQYTDENLLPSSIPAAQFAALPQSCIPLRNMFRLAGIENIDAALSEAKAKSRNALDNFLSSVAAKTTKHFRGIWKEYKNIEFTLRADGENLIPGIKEKNVFDLEVRSDGFKRFVSFLLLVSALVESGHLSETLLLIDEPDISLHPSGARYLRDELIKISKSNTVVFSTHSIFMIDKDRIDRHLILKKIDEKTTVDVATDTNIFAEEVLFNAVGYSVFETLRQKNIIFEGWRDKQLFTIATKRFPPRYSHLKVAFENVGVSHAKGVKHIKSISPLMELAGRDCIIVSDSDAPSREKQKEYTEERGYGFWLRYDELLNAAGDRCHLTSEDFIKESAFLLYLKPLKAKHSDLPELNMDVKAEDQSRLEFIDRWLSKGGVTAEVRKADLALVKVRISDGLKSSEIDDRYYEILEALSTRLVADRL
jgi:hypothetical protein